MYIFRVMCLEGFFLQHLYRMWCWEFPIRDSGYGKIIKNNLYLVIRQHDFKSIYRRSFEKLKLTCQLLIDIYAVFYYN